MTDTPPTDRPLTAGDVPLLREGALGLRTRFMRKVEISTETDCWLWKGQARAGYGRAYCRTSGKKEGAHRVSYEIFNGEIPAGLLVLHRCDVKLCVNPDHLFLGTQAENMADMKAKGRAWTGKRSGVPMTEAQCRFIRENPTLSSRAVAASLGVHNVTVSNFRRRSNADVF